MSWETQFTDLMPHTVTVRARASRNSDGSDTFSTAASSLTARVVTTRKWVRNSEGTVVRASQEAWVASTGTLAADSRYTLPDGTSPPVLVIESYADGDGTHHGHIVFS